MDERKEAALAKLAEDLQTTSGVTFVVTQRMEHPNQMMRIMPGEWAGGPDAATWLEGIVEDARRVGKELTLRVVRRGVESRP